MWLDASQTTLVVFSILDGNRSGLRVLGSGAKADTPQAWFRPAEPGPDDSVTLLYLLSHTGALGVLASTGIPGTGRIFPRGCTCTSADSPAHKNQAGTLQMKTSKNQCWYRGREETQTGGGECYCSLQSPSLIHLG